MICGRFTVCFCFLFLLDVVHFIFMTMTTDGDKLQTLHLVSLNCQRWPIPFAGTISGCHNHFKVTTIISLTDWDSRENWNRDIKPFTMLNPLAYSVIWCKFVQSGNGILGTYMCFCHLRRCVPMANCGKKRMRIMRFGYSSEMSPTIIVWSSQSPFLKAIIVVFPFWKLDSNTSHLFRMGIIFIPNSFAFRCWCWKMFETIDWKWPSDFKTILFFCFLLLMTQLRI